MVGFREKVPGSIAFNLNSANYLGLTIDPINRFIKRTALNPAFTLAIILLARYTKKGSDLSILHEKAFGRVKTLFYFGLARLVTGYFDRGVLDNWTTDKYDWDKEIVLITGGAGGIGGHVVRLLAERRIKVVVLDVIPMTYEARKSQSASQRGSLLTGNISLKCLLLQMRHHLHFHPFLCCCRSSQRCRRSHNPYQQCWRCERETNTRFIREGCPLHVRRQYLVSLLVGEGIHTINGEEESWNGGHSGITRCVCDGSKYGRLCCFESCSFEFP